MSPSGIHERIKTLLGQLIEMYALERGIVYEGLGSVTCRRKDLRVGLEPDECYYIQHQPPAGEELDLNIHPPPDLAVEVDITSSSIDRQSIYSRLGVPEIWRFDGRAVTILFRRRDGSYELSAHSLAFPQLSGDDINRFVAMAVEGTNYTAIVAFRDWLRKS